QRCRLLRRLPPARRRCPEARGREGDPGHPQARHRSAARPPLREAVEVADSIFGPIVTGADVERAALDTLKTWAPEYLAWVERATGREPGSLARPRSWVNSTSIDRWPEEQLPSVLLLSTGLAEEPARD